MCGFICFSHKRLASHVLWYFVVPPSALPEKRNWAMSLSVFLSMMLGSSHRIFDMLRRIRAVGIRGWVRKESFQDALRRYVSLREPVQSVSSPRPRARFSRRRAWYSSKAPGMDVTSSRRHSECSLKSLIEPRCGSTCHRFSPFRPIWNPLRSSPGEEAFEEDAITTRQHRDEVSLSSVVSHTHC
jgi:hypothetical protein